MERVIELLRKAIADIKAINGKDNWDNWVNTKNQLFKGEISQAIGILRNDENLMTEAEKTAQAQERILKSALAETAFKQMEVKEFDSAVERLAKTIVCGYEFEKGGNYYCEKCGTQLNEDDDLEWEHEEECNSHRIVAAKCPNCAWKKNEGDF